MRGAKLTQEGVEHSTYTYNGVDRVNNSDGYTIKNCVPCCAICNYAKRDLSETEFVAWARRLVAHQDSKV